MLEDGKKVTVHMSGRAYERMWVSSVKRCMHGNRVLFILKQKILDLQMTLGGSLFVLSRKMFLMLYSSRL